MDELRLHMEYATVQQEQGDAPGGDGAGSARASTRSVDDVAGTLKRERDGEDSDSTDGRSGGGKRSGSSRARSSPSPFSGSSSSNFGHDNRPQASASSASGASTGHGKGGSDDGEKELHQLYLDLKQTGEIYMLQKSAKNTSLQVVFCNKNGQQREAFAPTEEVYIQLTFKNPTEEDAYVVLHRKNFGRGALTISLGDEVQRYTITSGRSAYVVAKISPGKSHTFATRKLCDGPKKEVSTDTSRNLANVPFWTPAKAGTYYFTVRGWDGEFPLCIRDAVSEEDTKQPGI